MQTLNFYICKDDSRKLRKNLGELQYYCEAAIYRECSIINPEFLVNYSNIIKECNYVIIQPLGGQYFIDDIILMPGGRCVLRCTKDVISSYALEIDNLVCNIIRQEQSANRIPNIIDPMMKTKATCETATYVFNGNPFHVPNSRTEMNYLLTVIGGSNNPWNPPASGGDSND